MSICFFWVYGCSASYEFEKNYVAFSFSVGFDKELFLTIFLIKVKSSADLPLLFFRIPLAQWSVLFRMCSICLLKRCPSFLLYIVILTSVFNICGISFPTFVAFYFQLLWYFTSNFCGKFIKGRQAKYQMRQIKRSDTMYQSGVYQLNRWKRTKIRGPYRWIYMGLFFCMSRLFRQMYF